MKSWMRGRPDHRAEGIEVVRRHEEAKAGLVEHEEETWQDGVKDDWSE